MTSIGKSEFWLCYRPFSDDSDAVRMVDEARAAVVCDTATLALEAGFRRVRVFSTVELDGVTVEPTHPNRAIGDIVAEAASNAEAAVCYAGSGMPAMSRDDWAGVLAILQNGRAVSNRMFSCDWLGVPSGRMLSSIEGEEVDNRFALRIRDENTVEVEQFERSARSLLDLDTPTDLTVLAACAKVGSLQIGSYLAAVLEEWAGLLLPAERGVEEVFDVMTKRDAELMIAGRISGSDWAVVDRDTSCRVRVLSEERGLRMRETQGRSMLAALYESCGAENFMTMLSEMSDSMIWDTRPFFSHLDWNLSRSDRFWADLGRWDAISHEPLKELVQGIGPHQVLTGGHSLVAGGMLAGIDQAWTRRELSG